MNNSLKVALLCVASILCFTFVPLTYATCIGKQECVRTSIQQGQSCPAPDLVTLPSDALYEPSLIATPSLLATPCPFIDTTVPLCCSDDNAIIAGKYSN